MNRDEMFAVVKTRIAEIVEGAQDRKVRETDSMRDIGADSLEIVEVVSRSMKDIGVKVPRAELTAARSLKDLLDVFEKFAAPSTSR